MIQKETMIFLFIIFEILEILGESLVILFGLGRGPVRGLPGIRLNNEFSLLRVLNSGADL